MSYPLNPPGLWFWLAWGALGGAWELWAWLTGRYAYTLSYQVWFFGVRSPGWVRAAFIAGIGLAATSLSVHFFGRFG